MVAISCPRCNKRLKIRESLAGRCVSCPECGMQFAAVSDDEPGEVYQTPQRPRLSFPLALASVLAIGTTVLVIIVWTARSGGLAAPSTCRELAEHLQDQGLDFYWTDCSQVFPAILIVPPEATTGGYKGAALVQTVAQFERAGHSTGTARITLYPTAKMARETAGTSHTAFTWGRFLIEGSPNLLAKIRQRL